MEEQYFLVRRLGLGRGVVCRILVVTDDDFMEVLVRVLSYDYHQVG